MVLAVSKAISEPERGWTALAKAIEQLATASDLYEIISIVRNTARNLSGADGVSFVLRDGAECHYVEELAIGPLWKGKRFALTACVSGWCMLNNQAAIIPDIYNDPRVPVDAYRPTFVKAMVMVPVFTTEAIAAIGTYWARPRSFSEEELSLLDALARSTAAAITAARLRESLSESQNRLTLALEAGGLGAWEVNLDTGGAIVTDPAKAIFGLQGDGVIHRDDLLNAIHPDDREAAAHVFDAGLNCDDSYRVITSAGPRHVELRGQMGFDSDGYPARMIGVVRDVTERHIAKERLEAVRAELFRAARLNDLGAMASALAHELNQPLAAASNYLHAAERLLAGQPAMALQAITKAQAQFVRTKDIIQRIRGFVGQGHHDKQPEDLETVCREILELARMSTRYDGVAMFLEVAPDLPRVTIDKVQIQQVLLNLLRNAVEAMAECAVRRITITARQDGAFVELRVADSGPGLSPDIAEHLFQPFHTTKEGGMGVGLSLCRKIVDSQGGRMWHEAGNPGAVFCFTLPEELAH